MAGHSATLYPFTRVYFDLWRRVQSHALTRDLLFEDLRQGRRVGYVDGKMQPKEFWERVSAAPGPSEDTTFYIGVTYDGEPLFGDVHVTDVLPDSIAVRIDAPLHVRLLDMLRWRRSPQTPRKGEKSKPGAPADYNTKGEIDAAIEAVRKKGVDDQQSDFIKRVALELQDHHIKVPGLTWMKTHIGPIHKRLLRAARRSPRRGR
jgi:hypothetical protein